MQYRKKLLTKIFSVVLCLGLLTGCSNGSTQSDNASGIKMYLTVSTADTFRQTIIEAAKQQAQKIGAELTVQDAQGSLENQLAHIKEAVDSGYDVILCNPVDTDTALQLQVAAGDLPIAFFNSCPNSERLEAGKYIFVGSNEKEAGKYQAEYILNKYSSKNDINVAIFKGEKTHSATLGRTNALKHTLNASGKNIHYVFEDNADWSTDTAKEYFNLFLKTGQPVDVVACNNDDMALGIVQSCEENHISFDTLPVIGVDATDAGCQSIKDGKMAFTIYQSGSGQGEYLIKAAARLAQNQSLEGIKYLSDDQKYVWVPFEKVDKTNVDQY